MAAQGESSTDAVAAAKAEEEESTVAIRSTLFGILSVLTSVGGVALAISELRPSIANRFGEVPWSVLIGALGALLAGLLTMLAERLRPSRRSHPTEEDVNPKRVTRE